MKDNFFVEGAAQAFTQGGLASRAFGIFKMTGFSMGMGLVHFDPF